MTPTQRIAKLDAHLARSGEWVTIRRSIWIGGVRSDDEVNVLAFVRGYDAAELSGGIVQGDTKVTISPSGIIAGNWPADRPSDGLDHRVPAPGDTIVIKGRARNIESPAPKYVAGELVRIDLQVRG